VAEEIYFSNKQNQNILAEKEKEELKTNQREKNRVDSLVEKIKNNNFICCSDFLDLLNYFEIIIPPATKGSIMRNLEKINADQVFLKNNCKTASIRTLYSKLKMLREVPE